MNYKNCSNVVQIPTWKAGGRILASPEASYLELSVEDTGTPNIGHRGTENGRFVREVTHSPLQSLEFAPEDPP